MSRNLWDYPSGLDPENACKSLFYCRKHKDFHQCGRMAGHAGHHQHGTVEWTDEQSSKGVRR